VGIFFPVFGWLGYIDGGGGSHTSGSRGGRDFPGSGVRNPLVGRRRSRKRRRNPGGNTERDIWNNIEDGLIGVIAKYWAF